MTKVKYKGSLGFVIRAYGYYKVLAYIRALGLRNIQTCKDTSGALVPNLGALIV